MRVGGSAQMKGATGLKPRWSDRCEREKPSLDRWANNTAAADLIFDLYTCTLPFLQSYAGFGTYTGEGAGVLEKGEKTLTSEKMEGDSGLEGGVGGGGVFLWVRGRIGRSSLQ